VEEILFKWIPQVGFPIAVAAFVLIRIEPKLAKLIEAITQLTSIVQQDSKNTSDMKDAIGEFRLEVAKLNGKR